MLALGGCAQTMAIEQPGPLTCRPSVLQMGVERTAVVGCLGSPTETVAGVGTLNDSFVYRDGRGRNATWSKVGRVFLYTAGDLFTLFLSQVIFMPTEHLLLKASEYRASVDYEPDGEGMWRVNHVTESEVN